MSRGPTACVPGLVPRPGSRLYCGRCTWEPVLLGSGSGPSHPLPSTLYPSGLPDDLTLPERGVVGGWQHMVSFTRTAAVMWAEPSGGEAMELGRSLPGRQPLG